MEGSYPISSETPSAPPPSFDEAVYAKKTPSHLPYPTVTPAPAPSVTRQEYLKISIKKKEYCTELCVNFITIAPVLGSRPAKINCPHCLTNITTSTESEANFTAHLCCLILLLVGCFPCSCIPYCMDSMQTVQHTCPRCKNFLGSYRP